jgi:hypothetical protein
LEQIDGLYKYKLPNRMKWKLVLGVFLMNGYRFILEN